jgi:hypothetical protein
MDGLVRYSRWSKSVQSLASSSVETSDWGIIDRSKTHERWMEFVLLYFG